MSTPKRNQARPRRKTAAARQREIRKMADKALIRIAARSLAQAFSEMMEVDAWASPNGSVNDFCRRYLELMDAELKRRRATPYLRVPRPASAIAGRRATA